MPQKARLFYCGMGLPIYFANLRAERSRAFTASSMRFFGGAFVSSELRSLLATAAISSTAVRNAASLAFDGLLKPLIFRTNCNAAACISSSVTGGSKLKRVLIFLHTSVSSFNVARHHELLGRTGDTASSPTTVVH